MHSDLKAWLAEAWGARDRIFKGLKKNGRAILTGDIEKHPGVQVVYGMYATPEVLAASSDVARIADALDELVSLMNAKQAACLIQADAWVPASADDLTKLAAGQNLNYIAYDSKRRPVTRQVSHDSLDWEFLHFKNPAGAQGGTDQRIYMNLALNGRGRHFREIVELVYGHAGFRSAKVILTDEDPRNDTALLYLAGQAAVDFALDAIARYQATHRTAFRPALPKLTAAAGGLTGVGRGMEPPDFALIRRRGNYYKRTGAMSFGYWRAALIFMALDRTIWQRDGQDDSQRLKAFERRTLKYFRAAGIDPNNPSVQVNPKSLQEYPTK
jgi:hypothetical protein